MSIKNFFIALGKAACYFLLYIVTQFAATYMFIFVDMIIMAVKDHEIFKDVNSIADAYSKICEQAIASTDLIYIFSAILTIGLLALFFHMRRKSIFRETWMVPFKFSSAWPIIIGAVSCAFAICIGIGYIPWPESAVTEYQQMVSLESSEGWVSIIASVLFAPVLEEIVFRGLMFTRLCRGMPAAAAAILVATIFAVMHGTLIWACYAFVCGILMLLIYVKYRSLFASIIFHMVFNIFGGYVIPKLLPEENSPVQLYILIASVLVSVGIGYLIYKIPRSRIDKPYRAKPLEKGQGSAA